MDEMPGMIRPDLQALPQVKDRMTFLYLEHCTLCPTGRRNHRYRRKRDRSDPGGGHLGAAAWAGYTGAPPCHGTYG